MCVHLPVRPQLWSPGRRPCLGSERKRNRLAKVLALTEMMRYSSSTTGWHQVRRGDPAAAAAAGGQQVFSAQRAQLLLQRAATERWSG